MKSQKVLRALLESAKMHDRAKAEEIFRETATKNNLSDAETNEGLLLIKKLIDEPFDEDRIHSRFIANTTDIVFDAFVETLNILDCEIPVEFADCTTIAKVKDRLKNSFNLLTNVQEIDDFGTPAVKVTFSKYIFSTTYLMHEKDLNLENFIKLAKLAVKNSSAYSNFFLSLH